MSLYDDVKLMFLCCLLLNCSVILVCCNIPVDEQCWFSCCGCWLFWRVDCCVYSGLTSLSCWITPSSARPSTTCATPVTCLWSRGRRCQGDRHGNDHRRQPIAASMNCDSSWQTRSLSHALQRVCQLLNRSVSPLLTVGVSCGRWRDVRPTSLWLSRSRLSIVYYWSSLLVHKFREKRHAWTIAIKSCYVTTICAQ